MTKVVTSDPDNSEEVPKEFVDMLTASRERKDYVVFQYHDGFVHMLPPDQLTLENVYPRISMSEVYRGQEYLNAGMAVRLRWDNRYQRSKAVVMGVDVDASRMDLLFSDLDGQRKTKGTSKKPGKLRSQFKVVHRDTVEVERLRREELVTTEITQIASSSDRQTVAGLQASSESDDQMDRTSLLAQAAEHQRRLKEIRLKLGPNPKYMKLDVPKVGWTFLEKERQEDTKTYRRLEKNSDIWVEKVVLSAVQDDVRNTSVKKYAKLLMNALITPDDLLKVHDSKVPNIGFAKLLGKENIHSILRHIQLFHRKKMDEANGKGKWSKKMNAEAIKKAWRQSLFDRLKVLRGYRRDA